MIVFFDASVLVAAIVGSGEGPSATVLSTVLLGGMQGMTVDNALDETARRLMAEFNKGRLKLSFVQTKREVDRIRTAPTMAVHPWINPPPTLLPENRKDAYLLDAASRYKPTVLLTLDEKLWGSHDGVPIMGPKTFLEILDTFVDDQN